MKQKLLHSFTLRAVMLVALLTTAIGAWAEETKTETFTFSSSAVTGWTCSPQTSYCGLYYSGKNSATTIINKDIENFKNVDFSTATGVSLTITVKGLTNSGTNKYTVQLVDKDGNALGTAVEKSDGLGSGSNSSSAKESSVTVSPVAGATGYQIKLEAKGACAGTSYTLKYTIAPSTAYTVTLGDNQNTLTEASAGAGVTLPERSNVGDYEFIGWSTHNYGSEETSTKDAAEIIEAGSYKPTANITLYPVYTRTETSGSASEKSPSVTISEYATANSWTNGTAYQPVNLDDNVSVGGTISGNNFKYYSSDNSWRIYNGGSFTVSTTSGTLQSVTLTYSEGTLSYNNSQIKSKTAVSVSGTSATFSASATTKITEITVTYTIGATSTTYYISSPVAAAVERPVITVDETFIGSTTASITCATEGATVYYRFSEEDEWTAYSAPLNITATTTIYAKATKGSDESAVASKTTTKVKANPTVAISGELTLDLNGETNVNAGTLAAAVTYEETAVEGATVAWSSNAPAVATIDAATGAVTLVATGEVTFTATYDGNSEYNSATATKTVTVYDSKAPGTSQENPYTVKQANANTPASGTSSNVYIKGIVSQFYNTSIVGDNTSYRYYISDDGSTTDQLLVYKGKGLNNVAFSSADDLQLGDEVIVYGGLTTYSKAPEVAANNYIVSLKRKQAATITVEGGTEFTIDLENGDGELELTATANSGADVVFTIDKENTTVDESDYAFEDGYLMVGGTTAGVIVIKANAEAAGEFKAAEEVTITVTVLGQKSEAVIVVQNDNVAFGSTYTIDDSMIEGGDITVTSTNEAVATVEGLVITPVAVGSTTITVSTAENTLYRAGSETFTLTVTAPEASTSATDVTTVFYESFDKCSGTGGNDGKWSGSIANGTPTYDNKWTTSGSINGADKCLKLASGSNEGKITTPAIATTAGTTYTLRFKAGSWSGKGSTLSLTSTGAGTSSIRPNSFTLNDGQFDEYEATFTAASSGATITFTAAKDKQLFLDEVRVTTETTPTIQATIAASGYGTFCSKYPLDLSNLGEVKAYVVSSAEDDVVTLTEVNTNVKGGTGLVLKGDAGTVKIPAVSSDNAPENLLAGTLAPTYVEDEVAFGLSGGEFKLISAGTLPAGKAYLPASNVTSTGNAKALTIVFNNADGIQHIETTRDPQIIYDLTGRRLAQPARGINIVNGKKVLVR